MRHLRSRWAAMAHDILMIPVAWILAYWLRYNLADIPVEFVTKALLLIPVVVVVQGLVFVAFGLYRGVWRFASIPDLVRIVKAVFFGTLILALGIFFVTRLHYVPRSVFILYPVLLIAMLGAPRFIYRLVKDRKFSEENTSRVLIVGAGEAGEMLVRDLLKNTPRLYEPVAFVDDDRYKLGKEIHGIRVVGGTDSIAGLADQLTIDLILIALPSATTEQMRMIVECCEQASVPFRTLPKLQDLVSGQASRSALREVLIDDLLGRDPVRLRWDKVRNGLAERSILVTGAGGSIGSELCRQLASLSPSVIILYERSEFNLYSIENDLRSEFPHVKFYAVLGDVCDSLSLDKVFKKHRPNYVFHAAAYKHVPMLESQVREAVLNNVIGTKCVALAAQEYDTETFVLISTDKAVNPSNVMGTTKRIAEVYCQTLNENSNVQFITVRFGNVLGSAGSVVPLFKKQIEKGGPVTVTHPDVTRYFMTTSEACQLILQSSVIGKGGEIFVLDMGEPVLVRYLAEQLIRLSGRKPGQDIEIVYSGLRPGEKLYEELFHEEENLDKTEIDKIMLAESRKVSWNNLGNTIRQLEKETYSFDENALRKTMKKLVPEQLSANEHKKGAKKVSLRVINNS